MYVCVYVYLFFLFLFLISVQNHRHHPYKEHDENAEKKEEKRNIALDLEQSLERVLVPNSNGIACLDALERQCSNQRCAHT
jgi:hypothetical protein